jgi:stage II sporulation protein D
MMVGPDRLRSTNFEVRSLGTTLRFTGRGWGHGVGLCQEGAWGQARAGYGFEEILRHYYPGCELRRLEL